MISMPHFKKSFPFLIFSFSSLLCDLPPEPTPGYNSSSRIEIERNWDIFTEAGFIYWEASQSNMDLGVVSNQSNPLYSLNGNIVHLGFQYEPGFKVGLGLNLDHDKWDISLQYTWFRSHVHTKTSLDPGGNKILYPSWIVPDVLIAFYDGEESWTLNMDLADLDLARHYFVGTSLSFRPFFGARAAWIAQKILVNYLNVTNPNYLPRNQVIVKQTSRSWAVGPRAGLETNWAIGKGVKLYGNGAFDLLFTQYPKLQLSQVGIPANPATPPPAGSRIKVTEKNDHHVRAHFDLEFGFGLGTYFANRKWHIDLTAGYQFQIFFDQNMFRAFVDDQTLGKADSPHGNLSIHGANGTLRLDF